MAALVGEAIEWELSAVVTGSPGRAPEMGPLTCDAVLGLVPLISACELVVVVADCGVCAPEIGPLM
ncbi:MAG: hypothetical protein JOZ13_02720 [Alphaproteobacteria bacterium]|nr:hypothetical protein [Alphaproteobacteria bacterium]